MKIAIIGSGISGLGAAYLLHKTHDITLYEQAAVLGGHSRTIEVQTPEGAVPVDTGFIVFNHRNYPLLTGLFDHLDVPTAKSDMSFGVSINRGWFEYGTLTLSNMFAQKKNLLRAPFWRMIRDVLYFNKHAKRYLEENNRASLGQCLQDLGLSQWFRDYYILAMGGAIWSTPLDKMLEFPAQSFIRFFDNHGLLTLNDQPQWYTVQGGSREYVQRLSKPFQQSIRTNCGVKRVTRGEQGVTVEDTKGKSTTYEQVIFACHSDQAMQVLQNPTDKERKIVGAIRYQPNKAILHSDVSFMPKRKKAWSSWVYLSDHRKDSNPSVSLSYWMNNLQPLNTETPMIVTLNPSHPPNESLTHDVHWFDHPRFDAPAIVAQNRMGEIQGQDRIWYCGAWQRYGFHEDGLWSAVNVATALGAEIPWK